MEIDKRSYHRSNTDWFSACAFGIAVHWTAQSLPVSGTLLDFEAAVYAFNVQKLVDQVAASGARYLLFTSTHALQKLPAPSTAMDAILPGRTCRRDLLGELADACHQRGLHFLLYYNHSCNSGDDPEWEQAIGYHGKDKSILANNLCRIVAELGNRYGPRLDAWWFDSSYSLDPRGPVNTVTTEMGDFTFSWERVAASAKAGAPDRLITFNAGMAPHERSYLYTSHQDYLAGEVNDLVDPPRSRYGVDGLQEHRWVCLDNPNWVHSSPNTPLAAPRYREEEIAAYLRCTVAHGVPVSFNLDIDQSGAVAEASLATLRSAATTILNPLELLDNSSASEWR